MTGIKTLIFFSFSATSFYGCQCCCNVQMKVFLHPLLLKCFTWWLDSLNAVRNKCLPPSFLKKILCRTSGVRILKRDLECCFCFNLFLNASNYQCCLEIEFSLKAGGLNLGPLVFYLFLFKKEIVWISQIPLVLAHFSEVLWRVGLVEECFTYC